MIRIYTYTDRERTTVCRFRARRDLCQKFGKEVQPSEGFASFDDALAWLRAQEDVSTLLVHDPERIQFMANTPPRFSGLIMDESGAEGVPVKDENQTIQ